MFAPAEVWNPSTVDILLSEGSSLFYPSIPILIFLFGILNCFLGYRFRNIWFLAVCMLIGFAVGVYAFTFHNLDSNLCAAIGMAVSVFLALLYKIALSVLMFAFGYYLFSYKLGLQGWYALAPEIGLALGVFIKKRWVCTVVSTIVGALMAMDALIALIPFLLEFFPEASEALLLISERGFRFALATAGMMILGFLFQAEPWSRNSLFRK